MRSTVHVPLPDQGHPCLPVIIADPATLETQIAILCLHHLEEVSSDIFGCEHSHGDSKGYREETKALRPSRQPYLTQKLAQHDFARAERVGVQVEFLGYAFSSAIWAGSVSQAFRHTVARMSVHRTRYLLIGVNT